MLTDSLVNKKLPEATESPQKGIELTNTTNSYSCRWCCHTKNMDCSHKAAFAELAKFKKIHPFIRMNV
jgi:hypothetical protein